MSAGVKHQKPLMNIFFDLGTTNHFQVGTLFSETILAYYTKGYKRNVFILLQ